MTENALGGLFGGNVSGLVDAGVKAFALYQDMTGASRRRAKGGRPRAREPWQRRIENYAVASRIGLPVAEALFLQNVKQVLSSEEMLAVVAYVADNQATIRTMHALPSSPDWVIGSALRAFGASEERLAQVRQGFVLEEFVAVALTNAGNALHAQQDAQAARATPVTFTKRS